jgi:hypothetical protein
LVAECLLLNHVTIRNSGGGGILGLNQVLSPAMR